MNVWLIVGSVIVLIVVTFVVIELISAYYGRKDREKFEKLPSSEKWKIQNEMRKRQITG